MNLLPLMESVFRWQGRIDREAERQLLIKTSSERVPALWDRVRALHPYDVPEVLAIEPAAGAAPYLAWLAASTR